MSTWAGIDFGPESFCDTQNYLNTWYFKRSERELIKTDDEYLPYKYRYKSPRESIARRLALDGFDAETLKHDFKTSLYRKIEACRVVNAHEYVDNENTAPLLDAMEKSSLEDWLARLKRICTEGLESSGFEKSKDYGDPILNYMLASFNEFYFEDVYNIGGHNFPCSSEEMYAVALMLVLPDEPYFILDATHMVAAGWTDAFDDFIEYHSDHTAFYKTFKSSLATTLELGKLAPENKDLARLLYANVITVFETYLGDTLTKQVLKREALLRRFVQTYEPFIKTKEPKSEIFKTYDTIREQTRVELGKISFHNVLTSKKIYQDVLSTSFPDNIAVLCKAVATRHDIVHRNGKTSHNLEVSVNMEDVRTVAELADTTILHIDAQIKDGMLERDDEG
jgi:hypothetical protein